MGEEMGNVIEFRKCIVLTVTLKRRPLTIKYTLHSYPLVSVNSATKYLGLQLILNYHLMTILMPSV